MAITIEGLTQGYDSVGAAKYVVDLNMHVITETKALLMKTQEVKQALQAGWVGQSEVNFETNLDNTVQKVSKTLDELQSAFEAQFNELSSSWAEADQNLVQVVNE